MKALTISQIRSLEEKARRQGISDAQLMERAGRGMGEWILEWFESSKHAVLFAGKGRNAGDGFVAARRLAEAGWEVEVILAYPESELVPLAKEQLQSLRRFLESSQTIRELPETPWQQLLRKDSVIMDALLGIGMNGPLRDPLRTIVGNINQLRRYSNVSVIAIDCPSGLGESFEGSPDDLGSAIIADWTLTAGAPTTFSLKEEHAHWVGHVEAIPIFDSASIEAESSSIELLTANSLRTLLPRRSAASHKGDFGHVLIIGGSLGMTGAAALAAHASVRTGAGLTSVLVPTEAHAIAAVQAPLEAMVHPDAREIRQTLLAKATAIAIGPGLEPTEENAQLLQEIFAHAAVPIVLDAGALTLLSENLSLLKTVRSPIILTPHPGEMRRLIRREFAVEERETVAREFCEQYPNVVLVLKGARTLVLSKDSPIYVNGTGNPGLAKGGSGDALTGIIAALLAQKLSPLDAARLGVWLHGRAADLVVKEASSNEVLQFKE